MNLHDRQSGTSGGDRAWFSAGSVLGDPHWLYHPVRLIGTYISFLEKGIRKIFGDGERALLAGGVVLVLFVTGTTAVVSGGILYACGRISPGLNFWSR